MASSKHSNGDRPELSIIIISFNTKQITLQCLDSVFASFKDQQHSFEIIVIDNASTDGSADALKTYAKTKPEIVYIANTENIGFGKANNQAAKVAKGTYLLLLNSDTIVLDNAIQKLLEFYREHETTMQFVGAKLLEKDGKTPQPSCGPFYSLPVVFAALFLRGDYWGLTRSSPDSITETDWVSGACIMTTLKEFNAIGGFSEDIFMYMEEIDLLYRSKKLHRNVFFYPDARFIHLGSASSGGKTYPILQVYKGFIYFYRKHHSTTSLFLLKTMLKLKALTALAIGRLLNNQYLIQTYEKAYKLVEMD